MVFAAGLPIRIYGEGIGKAKITFAGHVEIVVSDSEEWLAELPPMQYGGPYELEFDTDGVVTVLDDIYVGEVFLFSGQSNMQFKLKESSADASLYEADEKLRLFSTEKIEKNEFYTPEDGWVKCDESNLGEWSAIGCLTGLELAKNKGIAIGVIACYQGASVIESWVPSGLFESHGINIPSYEKYPDHFIYSEWNADGTLYSYALSQVAPFSVSAVVWYQGESDTSPAESLVYGKELELLINQWRNDFRNNSLPFAVIQISDFVNRNDEAWKNVQKAQYDIQFKIPGIKSITSADVCENNNIHPPTKHILAKKVATALELFTSR